MPGSTFPVCPQMIIPLTKIPHFSQAHLLSPPPPMHAAPCLNTRHPQHSIALVLDTAPPALFSLSAAGLPSAPQRMQRVGGAQAAPAFFLHLSLALALYH